MLFKIKNIKFRLRNKRQHLIDIPISLLFSRTMELAYDFSPPKLENFEHETKFENHRATRLPDLDFIHFEKQKHQQKTRCFVFVF